MKQMPRNIELAIGARRKRQQAEPRLPANESKGPPATMKQLNLVTDLRAEFGFRLEGVGSLTMDQADAEIRDLKHRRAQRRRAHERSRRRVPA
jgi:hypothetical protein